MPGVPEFELGRVMDFDRHVIRAAIEHVAACGAVGCDEMQVVAGDVDAAQVVGREKADDGALDVVKLEDWFVAGGILEAN